MPEIPGQRHWASIAVDRFRTERVAGTTEPRQAVVTAINRFFTLAIDKRTTLQHGSTMQEDFIERTLRERRSLHDVLADISGKHARIPSGTEKRMLERMITVLEHEITLRTNRRGDRNDVAP